MARLFLHLAYPVAKLLKKQQSATFNKYFLILFMHTAAQRRTTSKKPHRATDRPVAGEALQAEI